MSVLTDAQVVLLAEAGALVGQHHAVLDELELEVVADVSRRFGRFRRHAVVTPREWAIFHQAVQLMRQAQQRRDVALARFLAHTRAA